MNKFLDIVRGTWGQRAIILIGICVIMIFVEPRFFKPENFMSIILSIAVYGILSCGMLFVVLIGGLDLSMGSMAGLSASICFIISQNGAHTIGATLLGILAAAAIALAVGYFHGFLATSINMPSFVLTLATKYIMYGIIPLITAGSYVYVRDDTFLKEIGNHRFFGVIPSPVVLFVIIALIAWFVLSKTTFGRRTYAIGGNPVAAKFVGIKVFTNTKMAYMISTLAACIGGIVLASFNMQAGQTTAQSYEGMVLMAMIVGGINLAGGKGTVSGAVFGALLIGIIQNVVTLSPLGGEYLKFIQGIIILGAVIVSVISETRDRRGVSRKAKRAAAAITETE